MTALAILALGQAALKPYALGGLKIDLPAAPTATPVPGAPAGAKNWTLRTPDGTVIDVGFADGPVEESEDSLLEGYVIGFVRSTHATLTAQRDTSIEGWAGLETEFTTPKGPAWARAFVVGHKLVAVAGGGAEASKGLVEAVLASLTLDPADGRGPHLKAGPDWTRTPLAPSYSAEFPAKVETKESGGDKGVATRRWNALFRNRRYTALVATPGKSLPLTDEDDLRQRAVVANTQFSTSFHLTIVKREPMAVMGRPAERLEGTSPDGTVTAIFQTSAGPTDLVALLAVVPNCLKDSPEVTRFLSSIKADAN